MKTGFGRAFPSDKQLLLYTNSQTQCATYFSHSSGEVKQANKNSGNHRPRISLSLKLPHIVKFLDGQTMEIQQSAKAYGQPNLLKVFIIIRLPGKALETLATLWYWDYKENSTDERIRISFQPTKPMSIWNHHSHSRRPSHSNPRLPCESLLCIGTRVWMSFALRHWIDGRMSQGWIIYLTFVQN